jgi:ligand-binding SRPBCC domain-containing protein
MVQLEFTQKLSVSQQQAWDFFSSPKNLNAITPPEMNFKILSTVPEKMYEGLLIHYRISPIAGISFQWLTEITHIEYGSYFVDEQRIGPYKLWHHEHHFKPLKNGVEMTDLLSYEIGMGLLGSIAGTMYIHQQVKRIFQYRRKKLADLFGEL